MSLAACSGIFDMVSPVLGRGSPRPPDPAPERLPEVKKIIANSTDVLFDASANAKNVGVSDIRRFDTAAGSQFGACVRASITNKVGKEMGFVTYVITVANNQISDRRRATPADQCDNEKYEPL
jgi:hypothetical protein